MAAILRPMASVTRSKGAHRDRRAATALRVLDATETLLRSGERFTEIPVERLLESANVSRSTFYVHFADKSVLLAELAGRALDEISGAAEQWWEFEHVGGPEPAAKTLRAMIKVYRKHAAVLRALVEVSSYDDAVRGVRAERAGAYIAKSVARMADEQARGIIPEDVDVELTAAEVIRLIDNSLLDHVLVGSPKNDARVADSLARIGWLARYGRVSENAGDRRE